MFWATGAALAELAPQTNQNADFGPNEVSKKVIEETSVGADNPFDQAAPGALLFAKILHHPGETMLLF